MMIKPHLVIGLGNPLMRDEGVGPRIIEKLITQGPESDQVEYLDLGTGGLSLVHALAGRRSVTLIDCAYMGRAPGSLVKFAPEEVRSIRPAATVHESDIMSVLEVAGITGAKPAEVIIFGIEPAVVDFGIGLSEVIEGRLAEYYRQVRDHVFWLTWDGRHAV